MQRDRYLRLYIAFVVAASMFAMATLPTAGAWRDPVMLVMLLAASVAAGAWPVNFQSLTVRFTVTHPLIFCTLGLLGPYPAVLTTLAGVAGATAAKGRQAIDARLPFNLAAQAISAVAACWVFHFSDGRPGAPVLALLLPLGLAASAYFLVSTWMVSVAIALEKGAFLLRIWKMTFLWSSAAYATGYTFAVCMVALLGSLGPLGLLLCMPPCWMLFSFYRAHREKLAEQERRIADVERMNQELENKVAERTREVKEAMARVEETNHKLSETNDQLIEASRAKSEFLAGVSHELRTPLNAIIGFSELVSDPCYGDLGKQQREFLKAIHDSGEHLLVLINDILDLSKIEAGRMEVRKQETDLGEAIHEAVSMLRPEAGKKEIELLEPDCAERMLGRVDPGMFREVVINLLSNAVKFTPPEGTVRLRASREGDTAVVVVEDSGIGIPHEDHERIFHEFYQVDGSYTRKYQGTGLGLALVKRMMKMHDGSISVESAPGEGAAFTCRFPHCLADVPEAAEEKPEEPPARLRRSGEDRPTVLVAEAEMLSRRLACNALRSKGFLVLEASDGNQALETVAAAHPDMVLVAENLPGITGRELARCLGSDPSAREIPVIGLLDPSGESDRRNSEEPGFSATIRKPIRIASFPSQVQACFENEENVA